MFKGKLRNHGGDTVIGMSQWMGRKIRHHDPLSETDNFKAVRAGEKGLRVGIVATDPSKVIYRLNNGKFYEIAVRQLDPEAEPVPALVAVGP